VAEGAARLAAGVLAVQALVIGPWAAFAPRSFYDDFPGGGRAWVSVDGPYNEHLVRDVGTLHLALAVVTIGALARWTPTIARVVAAGWLADALPHLVYHVRHRDVLAGVDGPAALSSLALQVALAGVLLLLVARPSAAAAR
jgi:hypothetical protein